MENNIRFPHLLNADILSGLDSGFKKAFLNACSVKTYRQPTLICPQGEIISDMSIIAHGFVDVSLIGEDGQHTFLARLSAGETFGESEIILQEPCAANCTTAKNTTLLHCATPDMERALKNLGFIRNITRIFHSRMIYDNWIKHITLFASVSSRLCNYLLLLSEKTGTVHETQSYLANMVGCSRQTINRELAMLREQGFIAQSGSEIVILDREALTKALKA